MVCDGIAVPALQEVATRSAAGEQAPLYWQLFREAFRLVMLQEDHRPGTVEAATEVEVGIKAGCAARILPRWPSTSCSPTQTRIDQFLLEDVAKAIFG